ncbi:MAG: hypothetical protein AAB737_01300, partial [Patescibacteria group bacterium]
TTDLEWLVDWAGSFLGAPDTANAEFHGGVNGWLPKEGVQYAELDSDWGGPSSGQSGEEASTELSQAIDTIPGETYELSYAFSPRPSTGSSENELEVAANGLVLDTHSAAGGGANAWTDYTNSFVATTSETVVSFTDIGTPNSLSTFLDDVALYCIPESVDEPNITLEKSGEYDSDSGLVTFTINWSVIGEGTVYDVTITDPVPAGTTFVSANNGGTESLGTVKWNLGNKTSVDSGSVSFTVALDAVAAANLYATSYSDVDQGLRKNATAILIDRTDPTDVLGAPQSAGLPSDTPVVAGSFFSLGFKANSATGGSIVVSFGEPIMNGAGSDIKVFEVTGGTYPDEKVQVEAWDALALAWVNLGTVTRDGTADLGALISTSKIRLTDVSNVALFEAT